MIDEKPLMECKNLSKTYIDAFGRKKQAVKNVSLKIKKGSTFGLVGESGCGKTTLGYTLLDLIEKSAGTIEYMGNDISMLRAAGLGVAMINGNEEAKRAADYITRNNNNNGGIAEVINKFILKTE